MFITSLNTDSLSRRDRIFIELKTGEDPCPVGTKQKEKTMANTYTQIYIQTVFSVQNRLSLIQQKWKDDLFKYIINQEQHHKKKSFLEEYLDFLNKFNVDYDNRYVFKPIE